MFSVETTPCILKVHEVYVCNLVFSHRQQVVTSFLTFDYTSYKSVAYSGLNFDFGDFFHYMNMLLKKSKRNKYML